MSKIKDSESTENKVVVSENDSILSEARSRYEESVSYDNEEREEAIDDLLFLDGKQWPDATMKEREATDRPYMTVNQLPKYLDQIIGDFLLNRPGISVTPHGDNEDKILSNIMEGMIRQVEAQSTAKIAYDIGYKSAGACGRGFWRIVTKYEDKMSFNQDIYIAPVKNQFSVNWDPIASLPDLSDGNWLFISDMLSKEEFKLKYPDAQAVDFENRDILYLNHWLFENAVRISEYWRKVHHEKTIYQMADGSTSEDPNDAEKSVRSRLSEWDTVESYIINGQEILEGPTEWPGVYIPVVPVWGKEINIENKTKHRGIVRFAKDPQRLYNFWRTTSAEIVSKAPKAPYMITEKQISGHEALWNSADRTSKPYLVYNPDPLAPGAPKRETPGTIPTGAVNEAAAAANEIQDTTGIYEAGLGAPSNERSGKAIQERRSGGDRGNYEYISNFANALVHTGKILVDLIPHIYDTERMVKILDIDGTESYAVINAIEKPKDEFKSIQKGEENLFNQLSASKYDVSVKVGPSWTTQREKAVESMLSFIEKYPDAGPIVGDLIAGNMDWNKSDVFEKRLKTMLPPEIKQLEELEEQGIDPEEQKKMAQEQAQEPAPDPVLELRIQQETLKAQGFELDNTMKQKEIDGQQIENVGKQLELDSKIDGETSGPLEEAQLQLAEAKAEGAELDNVGKEVDIQGKEIEQATLPHLGGTQG